MANLVKLPSMPSSRKATALTPCECGCGDLAAQRFKPGHDARLKGWTLRVLRGLLTVEWIAKHASKGEAAAVKRALDQRVLAGINWPVELKAMRARLKQAESPPEPTETEQAAS